MIKSYLYYPIFLLLICVDPGYGQTKPSLLKDDLTISTGPKLKRTLGTNEYATLLCILEDKSGNHWFGTSGEGIYKFDGKEFTNFTTKDGLSHDCIFSILEDNTGTLWFATANGVTCYDGKKFTIIPITEIQSRTNYEKTTANMYGMAIPFENYVYSVMQDKKGNIWFGTPLGVYRYDPSTSLRTGSKTYSHFTVNDSVKNNTGVPIQSIESIKEDKSGTIWIGGRGTQGLFSFDGKILTHYDLDKYWVKPLLADTSGNVWFTTQTRMFRFDGKTFDYPRDQEFFQWGLMAEDVKGKFLFFAKGHLFSYDGTLPTKVASMESISNKEIFCTYVDRSGKFWAGTRNIGLYRLDGNTFTSFSE